MVIYKKNFLYLIGRRFFSYSEGISIISFCFTLFFFLFLYTSVMEEQNFFSLKYKGLSQYEMRYIYEKYKSLSQYIYNEV